MVQVLKAFHHRLRLISWYSILALPMAILAVQITSLSKLSDTCTADDARPSLHGYVPCAGDFCWIRILTRAFFH